MGKKFVYGFLAGYSHFFAGNFVEETGPSDDADFAYLQIEAKVP